MHPSASIPYLTHCHLDPAPPLRSHTNVQWGGQTYAGQTFYRLYANTQTTVSRTFGSPIINRASHQIYNYIPGNAQFITEYITGLTAAPGATVLGEWPNGQPAVVARDMRGLNVDATIRVIDINARPGRGAGVV